jgi:hypothetical protein
MQDMEFEPEIDPDLFDEEFHCESLEEEEYDDHAWDDDDLAEEEE